MEKSQNIAGLVCSGRKDYHILPLSVARLWRLSPVSHIYVVTEDDEEIPALDIMEERVSLSRHTDREVLPKQPPEIMDGRRRGWYIQQFIKLTNTVCKERWQLVVDADTMLTKQYNPFNDRGKPVWFHNPRGHDIGDATYKRFNESLFGLEVNYDFKFVSEVCFYDRMMLNKMIEKAGCSNRKEFIDRVCELIDTVGAGIPAESELYMGYVHTEHEGVYALEKITFTMTGKYTRKDGCWDPVEVEVRSSIHETNGKYSYAAYHHWL